MEKPLELLQGTLDVLKAFSLRPLHGYGILLRTQQNSRDRTETQQGSLCPVLYRLEHEGLIRNACGEPENKHKTKYYRLMEADKCIVQTEAEHLRSMADVIAGILQTTPEEV